MSSPAEALPEPTLADVVRRRARGLLAEHDMLQAELALKMGMSSAAMNSRINEGGARVKDFDLVELPRLAFALETSVEYLLGLTNDRSPRAMTEGSVNRYATWDLNPEPAGLRATRTGLERVLEAIDELDELTDQPAAEQFSAATPKGQRVVELATFESKRERRWADATFRHQVTRVFSRRKPA